MTTPPAVAPTPDNVHEIAGYAPRTVDRFADGAAAVSRAADPLHRHLAELRRRISGLRDLVGSGAVAAPLSDAAVEVEIEVGGLVDFARAAVAELLTQRRESAEWASIVGRVRTIALAPSATRGAPALVVPTAESDAEAEVIDLWLSRENARDLAANLEAQNARLSTTVVEVAGTRAYARALEDRMASWAQRGRPVTEGMVKAAVRDAAAAAEAAHAEATAAALAAAAHAEIGS